MEHKELFDKALTEISDRYSFSSDRETAVKIMERAKQMQKSKEKRRGIFNAAACTAAAVAVIGGSVLGLGYINEHGGLRQRGTGYHDELSASSDVKESKNILDAAGDRFDFDDAAVEIESVDYDGQFIRVKYTVENIGENSSDESWRSLALIIHPTEYGDPQISYHNSNRELGMLSDKKEEKIAFGDLILDPGESAKVELCANSPGLFGASEPVAAAYTVTGMDKSEGCYTVSKKIGFMSGLYGKSEIYSAELSAYGVNLLHSKNFVADKDFSFTIKYRGGTQLELNDKEKAGSGTSSSGEEDFARTYIEIYNGDPIDVNDIASLIINGEEIPLNFYTGMEFKKTASLLNELESEGIQSRIICARDENIPSGCVIRTEPQYGLLDTPPENLDLYVSSGAAAEKTFDIGYRAVGEPSGIQEIIHAGYAEGKTYIHISRFLCEDFINEAAADSSISESFISKVSAYCDENGALDTDRLCSELETVDVRGILDNEAVADRKYFRVDDNYILCISSEYNTALVLADAELGAPYLTENWPHSMVRYTDIRHITELLWAVYEGFPDITVTAEEELDSGSVTLEISVSGEEIPILKQYLADNGADLSLCKFMELSVF